MIRLARLEDVPAMKELWIEFIDFHAERDSCFRRNEHGHEQFGTFVTENIEKEEWLVVVAEEDERVVGYCMAKVVDRPPVFVKTRFGYIQDMAVSERSQRRGIGTNMYNVIVDWFKEKGVDRVELTASTKNEKAMAFWTRLGFEAHMVTMNIGI